MRGGLTGHRIGCDGEQKGGEGFEIKSQQCLFSKLIFEASENW